MFKKVLPLKSLKALTVLNKHEDPFVDGLRGLSVLMVIWFHTLYAVNFGFDADFFQSYLAQFPSWAQFIFGFDKAVDIFFMISAYLLGKSLLRQATTDRIHARQFYIHRFFRIYPLFLFALILFGLGDKNFLDKLLANLFFVDNYFHNTVIPVGWSLSVEMQCYLFLPWIIWLAHKSRHPLMLLWGLFAVSIFVRWWMIQLNPLAAQVPFVDFVTGEQKAGIYMESMYYSTPGRFGSFIAGLLWAYAANSEAVSHAVKRFFSHRVSYHLVLASLFIVLYWSMRFPVYLQGADYYAHFSETFNFYAVWLHRFVFVLALLAVILLLEPSIKQGGGALFRRTFELPFWRVFSKMAFPMYLFHFPFIALGWLLVLRTTELSGFDQITLWQTLQAFIFATVLVTWFSLPLHFKLENKGILLGKRLAKRL